MNNIGIALQLYTLREPGAKDPLGTLRRARDLGFDYAQWSGLPDMPAEEARKLLDNAGVKAIAAHDNIEAFETDFDGRVAYWRALGAPDVAPGGMMPDCTGSLDAWIRGAARINAVGEKLASVGMRLSYHNHAFELERFEGDDRAKLDILYEATGAEALYAELDTAWLHIGGVDPSEYIRKYAFRCPVIHVKDVAADPAPGGGPQFTALGQGVLDWDSIFDACEEAGVEWCVYEQDNTAGDIFDDVAASYNFLSQYV